MKMTRRFSSWRAIAPVAFAVAALGGLAPTPVHRSDNCNNNAFASYWGHGSWGNSAVDEVNQRWEFSNAGPTGASSSAGVTFLPYGINWKHDFHVEFTYRLNINAIAGTKELTVGTTLALSGLIPETLTGLSAGLLRDKDGLWLAILHFDNGAVIDSAKTLITQVSGKIDVDWDKSLDRLTVQRNGGASAHFDGFYAALGGASGTTPMQLNLGVTTFNGNISFTGPNCHMDNFEADFVKRNFPP